MLFNGLILATMTTVGFLWIYRRLPRRVRKWIERHDLLTDAFALLLTYMLLGGTLTALFAASLVGLMVSALLYIAKNPEDFQILFDFIALTKENVLKFQGYIREHGRTYREEKAIANAL
jgi:hypothetical protein